MAKEKYIKVAGVLCLTLKGLFVKELVAIAEVREEQLQLYFLLFNQMIIQINDLYKIINREYISSNQ